MVMENEDLRNKILNPQRKRILFIEPDLPYPLDSGGNQAIYNGIQSVMNDMDVFVTFMEGWHYSDEGMKAIQERLPKVEFLPFSPKTEDEGLSLFERTIASLYYRTTYKKRRKPDHFNSLYTCESFPNDYLQYLNEKICELSIDIVIVEMPWMMSIVTALPTNVKKVFIHHELRFVRNILELENLGYSLFRESAVKVAKILEVGLLNMYDAIVTLSDVDKRKLESIGVTTPVFSSFAIVDKNSDYECIEIIKPNILTFVGFGYHLPNKVGLRWFLDNCWGKLLTENPNYHLNIIGKWENQDIASFTKKYSHVHFLGFVDKLYDELNGTVMIVPITIGSGIRMKILEAANMSIPFVTTSVGVEGLDFINGKDCFIADTPETFIAGIRALESKDLQNRMTTSAKETVSTQYSIEALRKNRLKILSSVCLD